MPGACAPRAALGCHPGDSHKPPVGGGAAGAGRALSAGGTACDLGREHGRNPCIGGAAQPDLAAGSNDLSLQAARPQVNGCAAPPQGSAANSPPGGWRYPEQKTFSRS